MKKILIIGAGMGAVSVIRALRQQGVHDPIQLVAPFAELLYQPSLIWVPTGRRRVAALRISLSKFFNRYNVDFVPGTVTGISEQGRCVHSTQGDLSNDVLIIASGAEVIKQLPGIEHAHLACGDADSMQSLHEKLMEIPQRSSLVHLAFGFSGNPKQANAMRGGPVFELLFGIDSWLREKQWRDRVVISFFSPATEPGKRLGTEALELIFSEMKTRQIRLHLGHKLQKFDAETVYTEGGNVAADILVFQPGLKASAWYAECGFSISDAGFIKADEFCRVLGAEAVYVMGDAGDFGDCDWYPKQGHMADIHGKVVASQLSTKTKNNKLTAAPELLCIVDMHNQGMLVKRDVNAARARKAIYFHWAKAIFEKWYCLRLKAGF